MKAKHTCKHETIKYPGLDSFFCGICCKWITTDTELIKGRETAKINKYKKNRKKSGVLKKYA